ncbi:DUF4880 domain-containing protein [Pseudoduganella lutea]|uniref:DUF4880 domain-containing protein n=2 Tax=Pseudoduganella lutea TaxID=321985 RepID=A0A4P6L5R6_9BURK|nr:DUF4880 domain-containing protein [Pseudoduganella lutea]
MTLHDGPLDTRQRLQLEQWRQRSDEHERAWAKATLLLGKFEALPPGGAAALKTMAKPERRVAVKALATLLVAGPAAWLAYRGAPWTQAVTYSTATGERRTLALDDGSQVILNTDTGIDIAFDRTDRIVHLRRGEILVGTAKDTAYPPRPFQVAVRDGMIRALGTRFTVRQQDDLSHVAVFAGAVEVDPRGMPSAKAIIPAGRQASFSRSHIGASTAVDEAVTAWRQGMLIADRMPMSHFLAELDRYRRGTLQCDPAVAMLAVSGAFPVADTDLALSLLAQTHAIRVRYLTRYWVTVGPA